MSRLEEALALASTGDHGGGGGDHHQQQQVAHPVEFAAVLVKRMDTSSLSSSMGGSGILAPSVSASDAAAVFARGLHDKWGVGDATLQNGVLVFISTEDRAFYVSVGSGLLASLPDSLLDHALHSAKPSMRAGEWSVALSSIVFDVAKAFMSEKGLLESIPGVEAFQSKQRERAFQTEGLRRDSTGKYIETDTGTGTVGGGVGGEAWFTGFSDERWSILSAWAIIAGVVYVVVLGLRLGNSRVQMQRGRDALRSYAREVHTQGDNRY
jgi:uncharacterized membrane protein YgcG